MATKDKLSLTGGLPRAQGKCTGLGNQSGLGLCHLSDQRPTRPGLEDLQGAVQTQGLGGRWTASQHPPPSPLPSALPPAAPSGPPRAVRPPWEAGLPWMGFTRWLLDTWRWTSQLVSHSGGQQVARKCTRDSKLPRVPACGPPPEYPPFVTSSFPVLPTLLFLAGTPCLPFSQSGHSLPCTRSSPG